jgi:hypothetical protein
MPVASPPPSPPSGASAGGSVYSRHARVVSFIAGVAFALLALTMASTADALPGSEGPSGFNSTDPVSAPPVSKDKPSSATSTSDTTAFRLGALAGVGFPRPVSFEVMAKVGSYVGLGAEYGLLPRLTIDGVSTSSWAASVDVRVFPFRGAFFLGLRGGHQRIDAGATETLAGVGSAHGAADLDTWFVNPRLGFLWLLQYGVTLAIEAGAQIPLSTSFSTTLPSALALEVRDSGAVRTLSGVLPTVDILRIGMLF